MTDPRYDQLADRLDAIGEEIADLAIEEIRGALAAGQTQRPASERRLTQARRSVDKASHLLRRMPSSESDGEEDDG
jgi:hypothetical protein